MIHEVHVYRPDDLLRHIKTLQEISVLFLKNLSPVIFSIFLNDLESYIKKAGSSGVQIDTGEAAN